MCELTITKDNFTKKIDKYNDREKIRRIKEQKHKR